MYSTHLMFSCFIFLFYRDFRHEKTKKKRGSYRGGVIDLQSHSIKFDNSDDEWVGKTMQTKI